MSKVWLVLEDQEEYPYEIANVYAAFDNEQAAIECAETWGTVLAKEVLSSAQCGPLYRVTINPRTATVSDRSEIAVGHKTHEEADGDCGWSGEQIVAQSSAGYAAAEEIAREGLAQYRGE